MTQPRIECASCGAYEPAGTLFCGTCGARLGQVAAAGGLAAWLPAHLLLAAFLGGLGVSVVAVLLLVVLGSDGGGPSAAGDGTGGPPALSADGTSKPASNQGDAETPGATDTVLPAVDGETPEPSATPIPPTSTPLPPTATTAPTATSIPPTATSAPPTATSAPSIPLERTSAYVGLSITGGHGSKHSIGAQIVLCYGSLANQYIRLLDFQPPGTLNNVIREGVDDGTGECISGVIEGPVGYEVFRIEAWNASLTSVVDYAELWIEVVP